MSTFRSEPNDMETLPADLGETLVRAGLLLEPVRRTTHLRVEQPTEVTAGQHDTLVKLGVYG